MVEVEHKYTSQEPIEKSVDLDLWETELLYESGELALKQFVIEHPDEPQTAWVESSPEGVTEEQYRQQSYYVIGNFGHLMDCVKHSITNDSQAEEWLQMKMTIEAAKSVTDPYDLAHIRTIFIPIWAEYANRMNVDMELYSKTCNK